MGVVIGRKKENEPERNRQTECSHVLLHSSNDTAVKVGQAEARRQQLTLGVDTAAIRVCISRKLDERMELRRNPNHPDMGCAHHEECLSHCTAYLIPSWFLKHCLSLLWLENSNPERLPGDTEHFSGSLFTNVWTVLKWLSE